MYRIVTKEALKPTVILYEIEAPMVARKAQPGQFIILRVDENGERIPITIHDYDREKGTVTIIVQTVGATTEKLSHKQQGEYLHDFVGPLGKPTETEGKKKVCVVGGGVGCAIAYPVLKKFHDCGAEVHAVVGFKNKDVVILEDKFKAVSSVLKVCTDDGSYGQKGLVTEALKQLLDAGGVVIVDGTDDAEIESIIGSSSYELFTVITSDALIQSDPELVQKAVNAMAKAMQWMETASPEDIAQKLLPLFDGAEEELLYDAQYDQERKVASFTGYHTKSGFEAAVSLTKLAGGITGDPTEEQIYDESFLDKAWETLEK